MTAEDSKFPRVMVVMVSLVVTLWPVVMLTVFTGMDIVFDSDGSYDEIIVVEELWWLRW